MNKTLFPLLEYLNGMAFSFLIVSALVYPSLHKQGHIKDFTILLKTLNIIQCSYMAGFPRIFRIWNLFSFLSILKVLAPLPF